MGLPALRHAHDTRAERPILRVVTPSRSSAPRRNTAVREARVRRQFRIVLCGLFALSVCGLGRVALSAQAIEASIDSSALRGVIKAEQLAADELELDKSSLMTPSRIEAIAGTTMKMSEADDVCFITISDADEFASGEQAGPGVQSDTPQQTDGTDLAEAESSPLRVLLSSVMDMAAGEAQILLVGDIGLTSSW